MPNITEMNPTEFRELLHTLVNEELFKSQKRLAALLAKIVRKKPWKQILSFSRGLCGFRLLAGELRERPTGRSYTGYAALQETETTT